MFPGEASVQPRLDLCEVGLVVPDLRDRHPDDLLGRQADELGELGIHPAIPVIASEDDDPIRGVVEHLLDEILGLTPLGDVTVDLEDRRARAALVASQGLAARHDDRGALARHVRELAFPFASLHEGGVGGFS